MLFLAKCTVKINLKRINSTSSSKNTMPWHLLKVSNIQGDMTWLSKGFAIQKDLGCVRRII